MEFVNDRRIPIEICLTSNVQTRVASSYETHPLRHYFDAGLNVVLDVSTPARRGVADRPSGSEFGDDTSYHRSTANATGRAHFSGRG